MTNDARVGVEGGIPMTKDDLESFRLDAMAQQHTKLGQHVLILLDEVERLAAKTQELQEKIEIPK